MNKIFISVFLLLGSYLVFIETAPAPQFDFGNFKMPDFKMPDFKLPGFENFNLDGLKACMATLQQKVPQIKECYDNYNSSKQQEAISCLQEKAKGLSDSKVVNECIPESLRKMGESMSAQGENLSAQAEKAAKEKKKP